MITVSDLTVTFGRHTAVDHASFTAPDGALTGFLGPNGAGKSATLQCLLGVAKPASGAATFNGTALAAHDTPATVVGALLDASLMNPGLTARAHLRVVAQSAGLANAGQRADECLARVGLTEVAGRRIRTFSLGMRQRLGIATALLGDPAHLVFDEPINGLDPQGIRWTRTMFADLVAEGRSVIVSSHLLREMETVADRLVFIGGGTILGEHDKFDLLAEFPTLEDAYWAISDGHETYRAQ